MVTMVLWAYQEIMAQSVLWQVRAVTLVGLADEAATADVHCKLLHQYKSGLGIARH